MIRIWHVLFVVICLLLPDVRNPMVYIRMTICRIMMYSQRIARWAAV